MFQTAWRNGDFSSLLAGSNPIQLMDPFTGQPYPGNQIGVNEATARADLGLNLFATSFPTGSGFPHFSFGGAAQDISGFNREDPLKERNMEWGDNFTWTRGRHTMKCGGVMHRYGVNEQSTFNGADNLGQFTFSNFLPSAQNPSANAGTGYAGANFYLGLPTQSSLDNAGPDYQGLAYRYGLFGQDSWKVSRRLTLNFGLRWEYGPPFTEKYGNISNFDRTDGNAICPNVPGAPDACMDPASQQFLLSLNGAKLLTAAQAGWPETLRWGYKKDFNPRLGASRR